MSTATLAVERCATCGAPIVRAIHERTLKPSVIDAEPHPVGDIAITPRSSGMPTYRVLPVAQRFGRRDLHRSHFATCPDARTWRRGVSHRRAAA